MTDGQLQYPYYPVCKISEPEIIALNQQHWECVDKVRELDRIHVAVSLFCLGQCLHANLISTGEVAGLINNIQIDFDNQVIHAKKALAFNQLHPAVAEYLNQYRESCEAFQEEKKKLQNLKSQLRAALLKHHYFPDTTFLDRNNTFMVNLEGGLSAYKRRYDQAANQNES